MSKIKDFFKNKLKRRKFFSAFFAGFIFAGSLGASAGTCYATSKKINAGSEYDKSYNIRYELDVYNTEDPNVQNTPQSLEEVTNKVNDAVDAYANYLNEKGINVSNIYPEVYEASGEPNPIHAYINAVVPNIKITDPKDTSDDPKKIDEDPAEIYFNDIYSSRFSIFYHSSVANGTDYVLTKNNIVNDNDDFSMPKSAYENSMYVQLNSHDLPTDGVKRIKEEFKNSIPSGDDKTITTEQPYMYIINDQQGFINRLNYLLKIYQYQNVEGYYGIYNTLLSSDEKQFCEDWNNVFPNSYSISSIGNNPSVCSGKDAYLGNVGTAKELINGSIFTDIKKDDKYYNFIEDIDQPSATPNYVVHKGTLKYSFMKKWIVGIVTNGFSSNSNDDSAPYLKYFPDNDPTSSSKKSNDRWLVIDSAGSTRFDTELVEKSFSKNSFPYPIKNFENINTYGDGEWVQMIVGRYANGTTAGTQITNHPTSISVYDGSLKPNIFKNSATLSTFIVLLTIVLLIGLIVSILYRIPGMMAFGFMTLAASITTFAMFAAGFELSVGMLMGLIVTVCLATFSIVNFFERIKKQIALTYDMNVSLKRGFMSSILSCLDLHIIIILFGIVLVYFGPSALVSAGVALVIGALLSFGLVFILLFGCMALMFMNQPLANSFNMFVYKRKAIVDKFAKKATQFDDLNKMTFFGNNQVNEHSKLGFINKLTNKTQIFGWRAIVYSCVCLAIVIIGLALIFTIGVRSSYSFFGGTRIMFFINPDGFNLTEFVNQLTSASGVSWYNCSIQGSYVYLFTSSSFDYATVSSWDIWASHSIGLNNLFIQSVDSAPITNFVLTDVKLMFIAAGLICAYGLIRLGWTNLIGLFVGLVVGPLLTISFIAMCQIYFDTYIVQASILVFAINALFVFNMLANVNNTWVKNVPMDYASIKKAINSQIDNCWNYYIILVPTILLMLCIFMIVAPSGLISIGYICIIGLFVSVFTSITFGPFISAFFMFIKHKYLQNVSARTLLAKNFDDIDEEQINGINEIKKERVYF